jgi:hypothetical protein
MEFNIKEYKLKQTKKFIETNRLIFYSNSINQNANNWIKIKQELKNLKINCYKIFNKSAKKALTNSIHRNIKSNINGITILIKTENNQKRELKYIINNLKFLFFILLLIKLNNKVYLIQYIKKLSSLFYNENKLLIFQFGTLYLKKVL